MVTHPACAGANTDVVLTEKLQTVHGVPKALSSMRQFARDERLRDIKRQARVAQAWQRNTYCSCTLKVEWPSLRPPPHSPNLRQLIHQVNRWLACPAKFKRDRIEVVLVPGPKVERDAAQKAQVTAAKVGVHGLEHHVLHHVVRLVRQSCHGVLCSRD